MGAGDDDRAVAIATVRALVELDRDHGVAFIGRHPAGARAAPPAPAPATPAPAIRPAEPAAVPSPPLPSPPAAVGIGGMARTRAPGPPGPVPLAPGDSLAAVATQVAGCVACGLCSTRTKAVPGEGAERPDILFVGEGPGADEDAQGRPFVGAAGQLLTKMIEAMGYARDQVFIANVVKCRPPGNRLPEPAEVAACLPYLHRQIALLQPKVICTLGNTPLKALCGPDIGGITTVRGRTLSYALAGGGAIPLVPTFHPAYLLRNPPAKKPCWEDLQVVLGILGRTPPRRAG